MPRKRILADSNLPNTAMNDSGTNAKKEKRRKRKDTERVESPEVSLANTAPEAQLTSRLNSTAERELDKDIGAIVNDIVRSHKHHKSKKHHGEKDGEYDISALNLDSVKNQPDVAKDETQTGEEIASSPVKKHRSKSLVGSPRRESGVDLDVLNHSRQGVNLTAPSPVATGKVGGLSASKSLEEVDILKSQSGHSGHKKPAKETDGVDIQQIDLAEEDVVGDGRKKKKSKKRHRETEEGTQFYFSMNLYLNWNI